MADTADTAAEETKRNGIGPREPHPPLLFLLFLGVFKSERLNRRPILYGARNVLSYTGHMMQSFLAFRDS